MDRNQTTGFLLMGAMLMAYLYFFSPTEEVTDSENITQTEQVAQEEQKEAAAQTQQNTVIENDSLLLSKYGVFAQAMKGESEEVTLENDKIKVTFNTRGGHVEEVLLKEFDAYKDQPMVLLNKQSSQMSENIMTSKGEVDLNTLFYSYQQLNDSTLQFVVKNESNTYLSRTYTLPQGNYVLDYSLNTQGLGNELTSDKLRFSWVDEMKKVEKDLKTSRQRTTVNYYTVKEDFDYLSPTASGREEENLEDAVKWVSSKQKFFNAAIITDEQFDQVNIAITAPDDSEMNFVKTAEINFTSRLSTMKDGNVRFYFGPNEYKLCGTIAPGFENNVYLGWSWVAPISKYIFMPLFNFLEGIISNYGLIILIMVIIVKSLLFPLTYRSYLSMAKMRVLKPEMDELKEKFGDDQVKVQQETMKIYQQVGVNPLSGCIPMVAQMPFFVALYNFFPNAIQLRGQSFLWADDLSSYDSILDLPFSIPAYGDHVSLFTLLWAVSMVVYTYFNNQMSTAATNPQMKMFSYITPVFFLFFFNSFSSGLTYYYFVSNLITIAQQVFSKRFIDEDKLHRIMQENRKKNSNKKKSGFQARLDDAMKAQKEQKRKGKK